MEKLALLNIKAEPGGKWDWKAYDQQGQVIGQQNGLPGPIEAFEEIMRWLEPEAMRKAKRDTAPPKPPAKKSRAPHSAQK